MMTLDRVSQVGKLFAQPIGGRLRAGARIRKDERRAMLPDQIAELADQSLTGKAGLGIGVLAQWSMDAQIDFLSRGNINGRACSISSDEKAPNFRERGD